MKPLMIICFAVNIGLAAFDILTGNVGGAALALVFAGVCGWALAL